MPINQVATISVPEPRMLSVQVWDKGNAKATEKAIRESDLGLNPQVDGQLLRIPLPDLSEERRKELSKIAAKYAESARIAVRNVRRDGMDALKKMEKDGDISQDDRHLYEEEIQSLTDAHVGKIDEALSSKEAEIMQV
jgi:ribosome recycling factor